MARSRTEIIKEIEHMKARGMNDYQAMSSVLDDDEWEMLFDLLDYTAFRDRATAQGL